MIRVLVDTHILLPFLEEQTGTLDRAIRDLLLSPEGIVHVSVATLWEIAIKVRLGMLPLQHPLAVLPDAIQRLGAFLLPIGPSHVLADVQPLPPTRDPFDRLLLAQCLVENLRLVTRDRALAAHPLAWKPA